jgi:hypothetical protein
MAWALSLLFAVGITTGGFLWHHETSHTDVSTTLPDSSVTAGAEAAELEAEISVWSQTSLFEELSQLETAEEEYLLEMLQSAQQEAEQR